MTAPIQAWARKQDGFYIHKTLGEILRNTYQRKKARWYWYRPGWVSRGTLGPFETLREAKEAAEQRRRK